MKKHVVLGVFLFASMLAGCTPSAAAIEKAMAKTQAALPTPSLKEIDLSTVIFQDGDLPAGFEPAQIRSELSDFSDGVPSPDNFISQSVSRNNKHGGIVDILIYEDLSKIKPVYDLIVPEMPGDEESADVGEFGTVAMNSLILNTASLTFARCHAVVTFQFQGSFNSVDAVSYAKRLDDRLQKVICD